MPVTYRPKASDNNLTELSTSQILFQPKRTDSLIFFPSLKTGRNFGFQWTLFQNTFHSCGTKISLMNVVKYNEPEYKQSKIDNSNVAIIEWISWSHDNNLNYRKKNLLLWKKSFRHSCRPSFLIAHHFHSSEVKTVYDDCASCSNSRKTLWSKNVRKISWTLMSTLFLKSDRCMNVVCSIHGDSNKKVEQVHPLVNPSLYAWQRTTHILLRLKGWDFLHFSYVLFYWILQLRVNYSKMVNHAAGSRFAWAVVASSSQCPWSIAAEPSKDS